MSGLRETEMQSMKIIVSDDEESQNSALKCNSDHAEQNRPDKALYAKVNTNVDENGVEVDPNADPYDEPKSNFKNKNGKVMKRPRN